MKKKILVLFIMLCLFIGIKNVNAGSLSINGSSSVNVNSNLKVTINFNNIAGRFKITSSDSNVLSGGAEDFYDNQTITLTFYAKSAGTATITVSQTEGATTLAPDSITYSITIDKAPSSITCKSAQNYTGSPITSL